MAAHGEYRPKSTIPSAQVPSGSNRIGAGAVESLAADGVDGILSVRTTLFSRVTCGDSQRRICKHLEGLPGLDSIWPIRWCPSVPT